MYSQQREQLIKRVLGAVLLLFMVTGSVSAQEFIKPQKAIWWGDLLTIPGVDTSQVEWLEQNADWDTATQVFGIIDQLSHPSAIQLLPRYFYGDASFYYLKGQGNTFEELEQLLNEVFMQRPPANDAIYVETAYAVLRARQLIESSYQNRTDFEVRFTGEDFPESNLKEPKPQAETKISIALQFDVAEDVVDYLKTGAGNLERAEKIIRTKPFHALMNERLHHTYEMAATHEMLVSALSDASSDQELTQLYRLANPYGFYHYAEVRVNADRYAKLIEQLKSQQANIESHWEEQLRPFVIPEYSVEESIYFMFGDGNETWEYNDVTAISLEYFKDNYDRLLAVIGHKTVHAMHDEFQRQSQAYNLVHRLNDVEASRLMLGFAKTLDAIYREGIATYIAPSEQLPDPEKKARAQAGADKLNTIASLYFDVLNTSNLTRQHVDLAGSKIKKIREQALQEDRAFYWLGREMAQAIVTQGGEAALAQLLREDALVFFDAYRQAVPDNKGVVSAKVWQLIVDTSKKMELAR